jgi:NAD(P)-dependent dehydrogenase (short-subunit alcohol dehydrogenase family)
MRLENKVTFISGGARGMGAAEAKLFSREGAKVVIGDILEEEGRKTEAEINEAGGECVFVQLDVTSESGWQRAIAATVARFGKLDILINNAGIFRSERVEEISGELWDEVMSINVKGVFLGTKCAIPEMRIAGGGSIINISSVAGLIGDVISAAYTTSKGAVRLFTKATAIQYASDGIRANSIHPGTIDTPMVTDMLKGWYREDRINRTPLRRLGQSDDVAYGALYLASDESSFVTGSELVIDGGRSAE